MCVRACVHACVRACVFMLVARMGVREDMQVLQSTVVVVEFFKFCKIAIRHEIRCNSYQP